MTASLVDRTGATLATFFDEQQPAGKQSFTLAPDPSVPDGDYTLVLAAKTANGQTAQASVPIAIDRTVTAFAVTPAAVSPNGDGVQDVATFTLTLARSAHLHIGIDTRGKEVSPVTDGVFAAGDGTAAWTGGIGDGKYNAVLTEDDGVKRSVPLVVDTRPPAVRLVSKSAREVWVNGAATVVAGKTKVLRTKAGTFTFPVRRFSHGARIVATDAAGNSATVLVP